MQNVSIIPEPIMECKQTFGTIAQEFMNELGLDLIFHYIRFHEREIL
jgi:hypothetical protein